MSALEHTAAAEAVDMPAPSLSWGAELRALFTLAWPLILAQLAQNALFTTDVIFMGQLGAEYLAAGTLASSYFIAFQLFGVGLTGVVAPLVAQALGRGDIKAVRRIVRAGFWASILLGLAILPIVWNVRTAFRLLGEPAEAGVLAEEFLHYAVWMIFPALMTIVVRSFLAAHGATRVILLITLGGVVVNALGNYALVLGNLGFPRLELRGSGITTTVVNIIMLAMMIAYIRTHRRFRRYHVLARFFEPDFARLREVFRVGTPIGLMLFAEVGLFVSAAFMMGWLGTDAVAGHGVAMQLSALTFMVPLGLSQATAVRVGYAFGAGSPEGVRKAGWMSLALTIGFMSLTALVFIVAREDLVALFLNPADPANQAALTSAASLLVIAGLYQIFDGGQVTASAMLRGLSDTKWPLIIALVGYWLIGLPVSYVCGFILGMHGIGIWLGLAFGLAVVAATLIARFAMRERLGLLRKQPA